jgi:hypothetical protein
VENTAEPQLLSRNKPLLCRADPEVFQLSDVGGAIMNSLMKIRPNDIQLEEDK